MGKKSFFKDHCNLFLDNHKDYVLNDIVKEPPSVKEQTGWHIGLHSTWSSNPTPSLIKIIHIILPNQVCIETFKIEDQLCKIDVMRRCHEGGSKWGTLCFLIPKKNGTVWYLTDFMKTSKENKKKNVYPSS
jgi:hypothetical protein